MSILETIEFRELIELFLNTSIHEIKEEDETPNLNFKFGKDGIDLFKSIVETPFIKDGSWTPNAEEEDIEFLLSHNDDVPTIYIEDSITFFKTLTDIINELIKLNWEYGEKKSARNLTMQVLRRIWLKMGIEDMSNVNQFLRKQLQFVMNRTFDTHMNERVGLFNEYEVRMKVDVNPTWDETTRSMIFTIGRDKVSYELPRILFDIDDDQICYIYGAQSSQNEKDKIIERKLYKINKNIENPNIHPSKVYAILLFIQELKKKGITKVRIPSMQVLSYRYHELLSRQAEVNLKETKKRFDAFPKDSYAKWQYNQAKQWYNRVYQKQDKISFLKTEELINLMYRLLEHDPDIQIVNDLNIQGDYLDMRIKEGR